MKEERENSLSYSSEGEDSPASFLACPESEEHYRGIFEATADALMIADMDGIVVEVNPAACSMYGYTRAELIGMNILDIVHPDYHHLTLTGRIRPINKNIFIESLNVCKDGSFINVEVKLTTFIFKGKPHQLAVIRDCTERRQAAENLQQRERYFRLLLNRLHENVLVIDMDYKITDVNETFQTTTGLCREEVIGNSCFQVAHGYDNPCNQYGKICALTEVFASGKPNTCLHFHQYPNGRKMWADILLSPW